MCVAKCVRSKEEIYSIEVPSESATQALRMSFCLQQRRRVFMCDWLGGCANAESRIRNRSILAATPAGCLRHTLGFS
eukprot:scaffold180182_cov40-Prasinocladus_malaysianus.AAC.1